jgi:hypothetical protein
MPFSEDRCGIDAVTGRGVRAGVVTCAGCGAVAAAEAGSSRSHASRRILTVKEPHHAAGPAGHGASA